MKPRNLLVILSDGHGARVPGCRGGALARTPRIDAPAGRGVRFPAKERGCA